MTTKRFTTTLRDGAIPIDFDPKAVFGKVRAPVKVTLNGFTYASTIMVMSGEAFIPLRRSNREAAKLVGDETLAITLELETAPRTVTPPKDLVAALRARAATWTAWNALSYSHQREHVEAIVGAKLAETRARRIAAAVKMVAAKPVKRAAAPRARTARSR